MAGMTRSEKQAMSVLVIAAGMAWLFFILIWLPPLTAIVGAIEFEFGLSDRFGSVILVIEAAMSLSVIAYGTYSLIRYRRKT
jgi:hypothetical protein